jgi:membrane protein YqaA with SNARE-associated domain
LLLALGGTLTAAYPVTALVVPAVLLAPRRWRMIAIFASLGSALGATLLVDAFHHWGWSQIYQHFPELESSQTWQEVMDWARAYGTLALFLVAASPLPQTPALIVFGVSRQDYAWVFGAMLAGKLIKYGFAAWISQHLPQRLGGPARQALHRAWRRRP